LFVTVTMPNAVLIGITLLIGVAAGIIVALAVCGPSGRPRR
jgi:hypothetical protein